MFFDGQGRSRSLNPVVSAAHAMGEERGRITIRTGVEADQVWLDVADTGSGIPPETLKTC